MNRIATWVGPTYPDLVGCEVEYEPLFGTLSPRSRLPDGRLILQIRLPGHVGTVVGTESHLKDVQL